MRCLRAISVPAAGSLQKMINGQIEKGAEGVIAFFMDSLPVVRFNGASFAVQVEVGDVELI